MAYAGLVAHGLLPEIVLLSQVAHALALFTFTGQLFTSSSQLVTQWSHQLCAWGADKRSGVLSF